MNPLIFLNSRLRALLHKPALDADMEEEIRSHVEMRTEQLTRSGMEPAEARRTALCQFGRMESIKEDCRDGRGVRWLEDFVQDVRFAGRMIRKRPGFSFLIVLILSLGIGVNTAIFSLVNHVLLRPLPYPESDRLVQVMKEVTFPWDTHSQVIGIMGLQEFSAWNKDPQIPVKVAAYGGLAANFAFGADPARIFCGGVSSSFLEVLGIKPQLGRNLLPEEDLPGGAPVAVLSHEIWQKSFSSDPKVIGQVIRLDDKTFTVVGVLSPAAPLPDRFEILLPLYHANSMERPKMSLLLPTIIGRLAPGVSKEEAKVKLDAVYQSAVNQKGKDKILVAGFQEEQVRHGKKNLFLFFGVSGVVLLIACANVAGLLLARAAGRQKEISVRIALGAGRLRIVRQLLTESICLSVMGGAAGLVLALWTADALRSFHLNLFMVEPAHLDGRVFGFAFLVSLITGMVFGLAPALVASRSSVSKAMNESGGRGFTMGMGQHRLRQLFVVSEICLAVVLLLGAGLLLKSFIRLEGVNPGFRPDRILSFSINLSPPSYPDSRSQSAYFNQVIQQIKAIPGVEAVGANGMLPFGQSTLSGNLDEVEGYAAEPGQQVIVYKGLVNEDYFRALGIPVLRGRTFTPDDRAGAPGVVIVDERFARRFFPNENPIGKRIKGGVNDEEWRVVVGVVGNIHQDNLMQMPAWPMVYYSHLQIGAGGMSLAVRTTKKPMNLVGQVRERVLSVDRAQPLHSITTLEDRLAGSLASRRSMLVLLGISAALALGLAALGIYGVMWYLVTERYHEIGIKMALGASRGHIIAMVLRQGLCLAGVGIIAGLCCGAGLTRIIASDLYAVPALDPATYALVALLLAVVALLACWLPARRASQVDPMVVLRCE